MSETGVYLSHEGVAVRAGAGSYTPSAPANKVKATMHSFECWQMAARGNCWTSEGFITQKSCHGNKVRFTLTYMSFQRLVAEHI